MHMDLSLLSPFWCLTHAAPAPFLVTSGLCPHPRSQNSPHPCPHSLGEGEGLAGWVSGHQAITTEPATVPGQPGTPLLALPGGPGVHPGEAWDWPMATAQLKGTIQSEYGGLPRDWHSLSPVSLRQGPMGCWGGGPQDPIQGQAAGPSTSRIRGNPGRALSSPLPPANCAPERGALPGKVCVYEILSALCECPDNHARGTLMCRTSGKGSCRPGVRR